MRSDPTGSPAKSAAPPRVPFMDLRREVQRVRPLLDDAIARVLDSGRFILSEEVESFERDFAGWLGVAEAVTVGSGTDAITIALRALGVGSGDEVITAANTCVPTAHGITASGARVVLVDCDPDTLMISTEAVRAAITPRTRALVPVHLYGSGVDMVPLRRIAAEHGLSIVEDCAQAIGTVISGAAAGVHGDAAAFSFYPTKNLGAYGDGGCVVTGRADVAERARALRDHGQWQRDVSRDPGLNSRLDEVQAAILRTKLPLVESWNEERRRIASRYREELAGLPLRLPTEPPYLDRHAYHLFPVLVADRAAFRRQLADAGVQTLVHYPVPMHRQPALAHLGYRLGDFPNAEKACDEVVSLPLFLGLTKAERDHVVRAVRAALSTA